MTLNSQLETSFVSSEYLDSECDYEAGLEALTNAAYRDYQSVNIQDVLDFCNKNPQSLVKVNVPPGISIEGVSQKLYNDKNYWDIIMILNNRELLTGMPKDTDILEYEIDTLVKDYFQDADKPYQGNIPDGLSDAYTENLRERKIEENVQNQTFIALNPSYIKEFLRVVKYS